MNCRRQTERPRRRARRAAVWVALLTMAWTIAAAPALAVDDSPAAPPSTDGIVHWSVAPADGDGPDGRVSLRHVLDPGETVDDAIAVTNLGDQPAEFAVTAGDGIVGTDGAFDIEVEEASGSGTWITVDGLDQGGLVLESGETRVLPITVGVPDDALPGDHPAGVVVGMSAQDDGMTVTHRIGVRLHLQVTGELAPALELREVASSFTPSWIPFAPGTLRVDYEVENAGNVRLGATTLVDASGPFELTSTRGTARVDELLPGDVATGVVETRAWPLFALSGDTSLAALTVGEDQVPLPATTVDAFTVVAISWTGLAVLMVLLVVAVVAVRRRRRRHAAAIADEAPDGHPSGEHPSGADEPAPAMTSTGTAEQR